MRKKIAIPKQKSKIVETRQFKHFRNVQFQRGLREELSYLKKETDPKKAWKKWKETVLKIANFHAPVRH